MVFALNKRLIGTRQNADSKGIKFLTSLPLVNVRRHGHVTPGNFHLELTVLFSCEQFTFCEMR